MASHLSIDLEDLGRLAKRALGDRVTAITIEAQAPRLLVRLTGLRTPWKMRVEVELRVEARVHEGHFELTATVAPTTWSAIALIPGQRLGGGSRIFAQVIEALGWSDAVSECTDRLLRLDPQRIPAWNALGLELRDIAIDAGATPALRIGLVAR